MRRTVFIFDMDGTLVDNMKFHELSWQEFFARRGVEIDSERFFRATSGRLGSEIMRDYLGASLSDADCAALTREKEEIYRELYEPQRELAGGLDAFLGEATQAGITLAVATAAPQENVEFILDGLGIRRCFKTVVGARDVRRGKPHPDVFLQAALGCGAVPQQCLVFEDAPLGVEAASRAGMPAVVLTTSSGRGDFDGFCNVLATGEDFRSFDLRELTAC
jgi:beta-phosphoglucomutase family hydrolase